MKKYGHFEFWIKNSVNKFDSLTFQEIEWAHQASWGQWAQVKACFLGKIPYTRHYNPLLIRNRSWILTIGKVKGHST